MKRRTEHFNVRYSKQPMKTYTMTIYLIGRYTLEALLDEVDSGLNEYRPCALDSEGGSLDCQICSAR